VPSKIVRSVLHTSDPVADATLAWSSLERLFAARCTKKQPGRTRVIPTRVATSSGMTTSHIPLIDLETFANLPTHGVMAIDFTAAWCEPCKTKTMLPILTGLAREYADHVRMLAVDHEQAA